MSRTGNLLDAVAVALNAVVWGEPVTIGKAYLPEVDRAELATLHVAVVVRAMTLETLSRTARRWVYKVDIGVQKRVDPSDTAEIDRLMGLLETVGETLTGKPLSTMPGAVCVECENEPPYSPEHLAQNRVFTGVVTLTLSVAV
jgi:hypothetical protein